MNAPKAFLSHATEDKQRFAVPLATALRGKGVDVWLDQWEMKAGDSLVRKVFTGIEDASVFIVVLSEISVTKPWVLEELDAAVIRKIQTTCKVIPVVLDEVEVPAPLKHLLWVSATRLGLDGTVSEIARSVFDMETKPPIGRPPTYTAAGGHMHLAADPVDNVVLNLIIDHHLKPTEPLNSETMAKKAAAFDISQEALDESISVLAEQGKISVQHYLGGGWRLAELPDYTLIAAMQDRGVDVPALRQRLLLSIVNNPVQNISGFEDAEPELIFALLRSFQTHGLVKGMKIMGGPFVIQWVSASAARHVR